MSIERLQLRISVLKIDILIQLQSPVTFDQACDQKNGHFHNRLTFWSILVPVTKRNGRECDFFRIWCTKIMRRKLLLQKNDNERDCVVWQWRCRKNTEQAPTLFGQISLSKTKHSWFDIPGD